MDFSKYEEWMGRSGWKKGQGLGKNEDGITKAIHIDKKKNTLGVGSTGFQHDNNWWDRVWENKKIGTIDQSDLFESRTSVNNSNNIDKKSDEDTDEDNNNDNNLSCKGGKNNIKNKKDKIMNEIQKDYKESKEKQKQDENLVYGKFSKSTFVLESENIEDIDKNNEQMELDEKHRLEIIEFEKQNRKKNELEMKFKEEFEACKGRTLRKYAPIGKLERLKAQDEGRYDPSQLRGDGGQKYEDYKRKLSEEKQSLKLKKQKLDIITNSEDSHTDSDNDNHIIKEEKVEKKDKKKKSKSSSSTLDEVKKEKKKDKKKKRKSTTDSDDEKEEKEVKKEKKDKKKKRKSSSSSDEEEEKKIKKEKKEKKKSKKEKK